MTSALNPRTLLETDHAHLDKMLTTVAQSVRDDALADAEARWNELETALLAHLDAEEMFVIPLLMAVNRDEARAIPTEHAEIRGVLGDIGIAFELHTVRADAIDAFCERLRAHAAHEEFLLYGQIAADLPISNARRLRRSLQRRGRDSNPR